MACLRTQGRVPKLPCLKIKNEVPQLVHSYETMRLRIEMWSPGEGQIRSTIDYQQRDSCCRAVRLRLPQTCPAQPPAHQPTIISQYLPSAQHTSSSPTSTRSPPWTPKNLVMPCPSGHHLCIQFHRIPQRRSTATSDILIHHLLKMQTQTCSYDFIYCLYHGEVEESVLYFLTSCEHQALLQLKSTQERHY